MKRIMLGIAILLIMTSIFIVIGLDITINKIEHRFVGSNDDFSVTFRSSGREVTYIWDGEKHAFNIGGTQLDISFIGSDYTLKNNPKIKYSYDFGTFSGSLERNGNGSRSLSRTRGNEMITDFLDAYVVYFELNGNKSKVNLHLVN